MLPSLWPDAEPVSRLHAGLSASATAEPRSFLLPDRAARLRESPDRVRRAVAAVRRDPRPRRGLPPVRTATGVHRVRPRTDRLGTDHIDLSTSTGSTRIPRLRTPSAPWPSWSPKARCDTSAFPRPGRRLSAAPMASTRSPRCSRRTRCGPGTRRPGSFGAARARYRFRALLAARPRLPHRGDPVRRRLRGRRFPQDQPPLEIPSTRAFSAAHPATSSAISSCAPRSADAADPHGQVLGKRGPRTCLRSIRSVISVVWLGLRCSGSCCKAGAADGGYSAGRTRPGCCGDAAR